MDDERFDKIARKLRPVLSRRVLTGLTSGLFASLPLLPGSEEGTAKKKRKKKKHKKRKRSTCSPACTPCQHCLSDGTCVQADNGFPCADDGNPCTNDVCDSGACTHPAKADLTDCGGGNKCSSGVCAALPTCQATASLCVPDGPSTRCCGGECLFGNCNFSDAGEPCFDDQDCNQDCEQNCGSGLVCVGFICQPT